MRHTSLEPKNYKSKNQRHGKLPAHMPKIENLTAHMPKIENLPAHMPKIENLLAHKPEAIQITSQVY